jgi:hypothetical protein
MALSHGKAIFLGGAYCAVPHKQRLSGSLGRVMAQYPSQTSKMRHGKFDFAFTSLSTE